MRNQFYLLIILILFFVGCQQQVNEESPVNIPTTKDKVYSESWNGEPVIVKGQTDDGNYTNINEINDVKDIETIIELLKNAEWEENVQVDIRPPDYRFSWNRYIHGVWDNKEYNRLEVIIEGHSSYGTLSISSSEVLYEILTGTSYESD